MRLYKYGFVFLLSIVSTSMKQAPLPADDFCGIRNTSFLAGEQLTFTVFYNVAGVYVNAGTAIFTNTLESDVGSVR